VAGVVSSKKMVLFGPAAWGGYFFGETINAATILGARMETLRYLTATTPVPAQKNPQAAKLRPRPVLQGRRKAHNFASVTSILLLRSTVRVCDK
jgi:hypothetical protein